MLRAESGSSIIGLRGVSVQRDGRPVLAGFALEVAKGELVMLFGESGSGKSTVFDLLAGELHPDAGEVIVGGSAVPRLSRGELARYRSSIGVVFQDLKLLDDRNVRDQIALPLEIAGMKRARRDERLASVLERFGLAALAEKYPEQLSMSERERVLVARAVVAEPLVLLADEPAAHLDRASAREIAGILRHEHLRGMAMLIGTSDEHFVSCFPEARVVSLEVPEAVG